MVPPYNNGHVLLRIGKNFQELLRVEIRTTRPGKQMMWHQIHGAIQNTAVGQESGTSHKFISLLFPSGNWGGVGFSFLILYRLFYPYRDTGFLFLCTLPSFSSLTSLSETNENDDIFQSAFLIDIWYCPYRTIRDNENRALIKNKLLMS